MIPAFSIIAISFFAMSRPASGTKVVLSCESVANHGCGIFCGDFLLCHDVIRAMHPNHIYCICYFVRKPDFYMDGLTVARQP